MMITNDLKFQKLTPTAEVDLQVYEQAINYIFNSANSDVRNIAISGAYSAGKSSVIEAYKKKRPDIKFMHISLAHFEQPEKDEMPDNNGSRESKSGADKNICVALEGKILNQLIHQIQPDKVPQTHFKIKKKDNKKNVNIITGSIVLFALSLLHITMFDGWNDYVCKLPSGCIKSILAIIGNDYSLLISGLFSICLFGLFVYSAVNTQINRNFFKKISLQGNEIEIFESCDDSYFDRYLNEVLYLFENVEAQVIVFEDMDRFNVNQIFERLREVNTLVNIQLEKLGKNPLRFFYLLRDDIFISKDRTKFFDYIIPIVPVLDSSNSYDQFISHFKSEGSRGALSLFNENFLQGLSLYIDDMRILKNIYNEFLVYYYKLNTTELDSNKMLALIAYKNLFPRDFGNLQLNQGFVFTIFDKKPNFISDEIANLQKSEKRLEDTITAAKNEHLESINELDILRHPRRMDTPVYNKRKENIENAEIGKLTSLESELSDIRNELLKINNKQLKDIINRENIDEIFKVSATNEIGDSNDFKEIKGSEYFDLLKYLIRNGFIDETYSDYMTYFYENSLNRIDKVFLRGVADKKAKDYIYQLKNPQHVIARLRLVDFDQPEVLNFDLLEYLLQSKKHNDLLKRLLNQLKVTANYKFISAFFNTEREIAAFVFNLNSQWPEFFLDILRNRALSEKQIKLYSLYSLYYSPDDDILAINGDAHLSDYISGNKHYLAINEPRISQIIKGFKLLEVSFSEIDYPSAHKELFAGVYDNSLYELNFENICLMLQEVYKAKNDSDVVHKNYSLIVSQPDSPLANYVDDKINEYLEVMLVNSDDIIQDDESAALLILNNENIQKELKDSYINKLATIITSLDDVEDVNFWNALVKMNLIAYSEKNILLYFGDNTALDSTLIDFINNGKRALDFSGVKNDFGDEKAEALFDAAIVCDELQNGKYKEMLTTLDFTYSSFDVTGVKNEKMQILIDEKIIKMTLESLCFMRENYTSQLSHYIKVNLDDYILIIDEKSFSFNEAMEILHWPVKDESKIRLLNFTDAPIRIIDKKYSDVINDYILENNYDQSDLPSLLSSYKKWPGKTQAIILGLAKKHLSLIIQSQMKIEATLLHEVLSANDIDNDAKLKLLISLLSELSPDECISYFELLGLDDYSKVLKGRKHKIEKTETSTLILSHFKECGFIYDFLADEGSEEQYKIRKNRPTGKSSNSG